ncbi:YaiY family protein [Klebsiella pneumoniae]
MAEFSFSKSLLGNKKRGALTGSHVAYGLFVLICCWAGAQMLSMLIHAQGVFERLMQAQDASRPQVDISLAVGTLFGLIPFLIGCTFIGVLALIVRWRQRR